MKKYRDIVLNAAQISCVIAVLVLKVKKIYLEWGRGTGKSFILAWFIKQMVRQMPRASFGLVGSTYQQILSRTLPSTKEGLEVLGIYEGVDYVVGKSGSKLGFEIPIQSPSRWDNIIHFSNGCIFQLVSLDNPDSGRGLNAYAILGDEAALFDEERLYNNVKTTNRAFKKEFENCSLLGAEIYASSTPLTKKGKWFTDKEKLAKKRPGEYAFIKASALINKANLRPGWLEEMRDEAPSDLIYNAEILNKRPKEITNGFYPQLTAKHYYTSYNNEYLESITADYNLKSLNCKQDGDLDIEEPLILSIDWGLFLSCSIHQQNHAKREHRILNSMYVQGTKDIEDLINDFCDYYDHFPNKTVKLYYGHDGNQQRPKGNGETYGDEVTRLLKQRKWIVLDKSKGKPAASHNNKFIVINTLLKGFKPDLYRIKINEGNNTDLIISMEKAEAGENNNGVYKIKKDERNKKINQAHATHLSDTVDMPIYDLYSAQVLKENNDGDNFMYLTSFRS